MKTKRFILLFAILLGGLACSFEYVPAARPAPTPARAQPAAPAVEEEPLFIPSATPGPATPSPSPAPATPGRASTRTPTRIIPMLTAPDENIYCRVGPSPDWAVESILPRNTWTGILGRSADGEWWYIAAPKHPGRYCFVAEAITKTSGDLENLAVVEPPQALVTKLNVELMPETDYGECSELPYTFDVRVEITTDGPAAVTFQRSMDDGNAEPPETVEVPAAGLHVFSYTYTVRKAGSHWVLIEQYAPNVRSSKDTAKFTCSTPTPP